MQPGQKIQPSGRTQLRPGLEAPAPGPARLGAAVDAIVGHLRRLVLLQAWAKWQPKLTQGEVATRILERQRLRLEGRDSEASGAEPPTAAAAAGRRRRRRGGGGSRRPGGELGHGAACEEEEKDDGDDEAEGRQSAPGSDGETLARASGGGAQEGVPGAGVRGRTRLRPSGGGIGAPTASARNTAPGMGGSVVRGRSSPAGASRGLNAAREVFRSSSGSVGRAAGGRAASGGGVAGATAAEAQQGDGECGTDSRGLQKQQKQLHAGDAHGQARPNGRSSNTHAAARHSSTTPAGGSTAAAAAAGDETSMLTMQTCFRQERESFIRDLQVLHR
ncbi:unnamed protein product, partial [Ectocarpus sp. 4 AP-2014]